MFINGIDFPNEIIEAIMNEKLVIFAGAGVSKGEPTCLPDFQELAEQVAMGTGETQKNDESCELFLGRLKDKKINVNKRTADILSGGELSPNKLHEHIVELFPNNKNIKIVTTNYDNMFEAVLKKKGIEDIKIYDTPALPLGNDVNGIVHIHGNVLEPEYMVVTDDDFGKAYLADGYVSRFLMKLFENYTVLFVGYSYGDVIVRYLTRAMIKTKTKNRYILTDSRDKNWNSLGVIPVFHEKKRFDLMGEGINQLGIIIRRGLLDWEKSLKMIAERPPVDLTIESEVLFCLQDETKTRVLIHNIHGKEWLQWIDDRKYINNLFCKKAELSAIEIEWADWIAKEFIENDCKEIMRLVLKHNNQLNDRFAEILAREILNEGRVYSDEAIKCIVLLVYEYLNEAWIVLCLNELVMKRNMISLGWSLMKKLFDVKIVPKTPLLSVDGMGVEFEHRTLTDVYSAERIWVRSGEKYIENSPLEILEFGRMCILTIHSAYATAGMATKEYEPYVFSEIPLEKSKRPYGEDDSIYVLCKIIGDVCLKIAKKEPQYVKQYIIKSIMSESLLLRKLGIKMLRGTEILDVHEKLKILLSNVSLHALWEKEQTFKLIAHIFDDLTKEEQELVLQNILTGDVKGEERTIAYEKYNWYVWLQQQCKENERVNEMISRVKEEYPEFSPRRHPELNFDLDSGEWRGDISPLEPKELLAMDVEQLIKLLREYNMDSWDGPSREGLLVAFSNCVKDNYTWTVKIVKEMLGKLKDKPDVWGYFFRGVMNSEFVTDEYVSLLFLLKDSDIIERYTKELSMILEKCIKLENTKKKYPKYKMQLHEITMALWEAKGGDEGFDKLRLIDKCCNCATGLLTSCWIHMLSCERGKTIPKLYKNQFEKSLGLENEERKQSICLLVGQVAYLFCKDRKWCKQNIFPFLTSSNHDEFVAAWEGVAWFSRRLNKELANEILNTYLTAVERINELVGEARESFISMYVALLIYVVENPTEVYIPRFLSVANEKDKIKFAASIRHNLENMNDEEKLNIWNLWIKKYWENRIQNIPIPLSEEEGSEMLDWLPKLGTLYPEAVTMFIAGTKVKKAGGWFWHQLIEDNWAEKYPDETARLVIYLLENDAEERYEISRVQKVVEKLKEISAENLREIREIILKKGYEF